MGYNKITGKELKKNFHTKLELNTEKTFNSLTIEKINSNEPLYFYFKEQLKGNYSKNVQNITDIEIKSICMSEVKNIIIYKLESVNVLINKENNRFFKNKKKLKELYSEQSKLQTLIVNNNHIKERIVILKEKIEDDRIFNTPIYIMENNENVYIVSQNLNSYLDIIKYKVQDITIIDTQLDNQYQTDFEFSYTLIDQNKNKLEIEHNFFRSFNGKKAIVNDRFLFLNIKDAKSHCILVLQNLQKNILDKIEVINLYEE